MSVQNRRHKVQLSENNHINENNKKCHEFNTANETKTKENLKKRHKKSYKDYNDEDELKNEEV